MNILIIGSGKGSWTMRGVQMGAALGARVTSSPSPADWAWAEVVVLVKRAAMGPALAEAQRRGLPIVWDALDFWTQPAMNGLAASGAEQLLRTHIARIKPALFIGATEAMARAGNGVCVPHHAWSGLAPAPVREHVQVVAYEGNPLYLGRWQGRLETACQRRGWRFVVNPPSLAEADIIVALRDGPWDGGICREWKSGVKVVNAIAAGLPLIAQDTAAVRELRPVCSVVEDGAGLDRALDYWTLAALRAEARAELTARAGEFDLATVAAGYRAALEGIQVAA